MSVFDLSDRVAIVTGGNGGVGLGLAMGLAQAGATVVITGRNRDKGAQALTQLRALGVAAEFLVIDITREGCHAMVKTTLEKFGRVNVLVNNAGGMSVRKRPEEYTSAEWHSLIDTNLTNAFHCCQAAFPEMKRQGGGKIINIGSLVSWFGVPFGAPYAASKGGVVQLTRALATAWAKDNIQVNAVLPGFFDTEQTKQAREQVPTMNERVLSRTPAGRWGVADDLSGIAAFLGSSGSDFITGAVIPVDGGYSAQL